jgi:hypothetical protein
MRKGKSLCNKKKEDEKLHKMTPFIKPDKQRLECKNSWVLTNFAS